MSDLENIRLGLKLYNIGEDISLNHLRIKTEDIIDALTEQLHNIVGNVYVQNDIIVSHTLNNNLVEANELYTTILNLINK